MVQCVQSTTMNIIWTLFVCTATCFLSDIVVGENSLPKGHNVLVLFRNGTRQSDVENYCRGVQVKYQSYSSNAAASYSFTVTSADCLDFTGHSDGPYPLSIMNEEQEWNTGYSWPKTGGNSRFVIHPKYNKETKEHNIATFLHKRVLYDSTLVSLPESNEVFEDKTVFIGKWSDTFNDDSPYFDPHVENVPTTGISSKWCKYLYPFSPLRGFEVCVSGWNLEGVTQIEVGEALSYQDALNETKLAGIATIARPHVLNLPIEFASITPYVNWLKNEAKMAYNV